MVLHANNGFSDFPEKALHANNGIFDFRGRLCMQTMAFSTSGEGFACKQWHFRLLEKALHANNGISDFWRRLCMQTMAFPASGEGFACKQWHFRLSGNGLACKQRHFRPSGEGSDCNRVLLTHDREVVDNSKQMIFLVHNQQCMNLVLVEHVLNLSQFCFRIDCLRFLCH